MGSAVYHLRSPCCGDGARNCGTCCHFDRDTGRCGAPGVARMFCDGWQMFFCEEHASEREQYSQEFGFEFTRDS